MTKYQCDNDRCGVARTSNFDLATYGTCKECRTGIMRRVPEEETEPGEYLGGFRQPL